MWGPGGAGTGLLMDEDSYARWGKRGAVVIEYALELCPGGEAGVQAGAAKEV